MRFKKLINLPVIISILFSALSLNLMASTNLQLDSFEVFEVTGDIDGVEDEVFYFKAKQKILLIASEITIPIPFSDSSSFIVTSDGSIVEWLSEIPESLLAPVDMEILSGDFNGDGLLDLFYKTNVTSYGSMIAYGGPAKLPNSISTFETLEGYDTHGNSIVVKDINQDGKDDLQVLIGDNQSVVAYANANGTFNSTRGGLDAGVTVSGAIAGEFEVGKDGSANYTIPIAVPIGGAGMQPKLAFSYTSGAGNGYLGMGWSVTQTSSIANCASTFIDDGYVQGDQHLCLDGQRMIETDPDTYYLANTNFSKIEKINNRNAYVVYYKSGEIAYFGDYDGNTPNANDVGAGALKLAKVEDRAGNGREYTYWYDAASNEHYLDSISYPGGIVDFQYESGRLDTMESWRNGLRSSISKRLERVETRVDGSIFRSYDLEYSTSSIGNRSQLERISECGADQSCLSPTIFDWSELTDTSFIASTDTDIVLSTAYKDRPHFVDINGDGFTDLFLAADHQYKVRFNKGDGTFEQPVSVPNLSNGFYWEHTFPMDINADGKVEIMVPHETGLRVIEYIDGAFTHRKLAATNYPDLINGGLIDPSSGYMGFGAGFLNQDYPRIIDLDGNGLPDILTTNPLGGSTTSNGLRIPSWSAHLNMDGKNFEALNYEGEKISAELLLDHIYVRTTYIDAENPDTAQVIDIDGDGKQELIYLSGSQWAIMEGTYESAEGVMRFEKRLLTDAFNASTLKLVDLNADGLTDLLYKKAGNWAFNINQGGEFGPSITTSSSHRANSRVFDYDDDGRSDVLYIGSNQWKILKFSGASECYTSGLNCFTTVSTGLSDETYEDIYRVADFDSDGLSDIITQDFVTTQSGGTYTRTGEWKVFTRSAEGLPSYLTSVTNGYGLETHFEYGQLFDRDENDSFYDKGLDLQLPLRNISGPLRVVKSTTVKKQGDAFSDVVSYKYKQLGMHLQGLGSLGFNSITSETELTKVVSEYSFDWENRTHGMTEKQSTFRRSTPADSWTEISTTDYENESIYASENEGIRYSYLNKQTDRRYKVTGGLLKKVETDYRPDAETDGFSLASDYGNMDEVVVLTSNAETNPTETFTVKTESWYKTADTVDWVIGRLTRAIVSSSGTNKALTKRESEWSYDSDGYLLSEVIEPNKTDLKKTTAYTYKNGLVETKTTSIEDSNALPRSLTTIYDHLGRYPVEVKNSLGSVYKSYDPVLGLTTSTKGLNQNIVSYMSYDGFGRPTSTTSPTGTTTTTSISDASQSSPTSKYFEAWAENESQMVLIAELPAEYYVETTDHNGRWSRVFHDRLGNAFETQALNAFNEVVATRTEYDKYGKPLRKSEPYYLNDEASFWTSTAERDVLQRPTRIVNAEGNSSRFSYDGLITVTTNEKLQTKTELFTFDGKLQQVKDNDGYVVQYEYDSAGNMTKMIDLVDQFATETVGDEISNSDDISNNVVTEIIYDDLGRKSLMKDPNKGDWSYDYNAFGELVMQTDAKDNKVCQAYDTLGRMVKRIDAYTGSKAQALAHCSGDESNPQITEWRYDATAFGTGKLHEIVVLNQDEQTKDTKPYTYSETYTYDYLSRPTTATKVIDGEEFTTGTDYDAEGRPSKTTYPSGLETTNHYNGLGALTSIKKADGQAYYWKLDEIDHRGKPTQFSLADGKIVTNKTYTPERGFVESIITSTDPNSNFGDLQFNEVTYDELANVAYRTSGDVNSGLVSDESFTYDSMNRLSSVDREINGQPQLIENMAYSYNGNISSKWDVSGAYQYGQSCNGVAPGHNAVTQANGRSYCYDLNGNMISDSSGRTINWASFGKPVNISKGSATVEFEYGPDRSRIRRIDTGTGGVTTTTYVGSYEKVVKSGSVEERHYIGGVVVVTNTVTAGVTSTNENYLLKDNLGSVVSTVDLSQLYVLGHYSNYYGDRSSFNSWGLRRNKDWSSMTEAEVYAYKPNLSKVVTDRGYTGHEQIDELGLIHMNGRVYDPILGRFISADPIIQSPTDLQSLNRYSYVRNNPTTLIDPSGFSWISKQWKKWAKDFTLNAVTMGGYSQWRATTREFGRFARKNDYVAEIAQIGGCAAAAAAGPVGAPICGLITASITYGVSDGDYKAAARAGAIAFAQSYIAGEIGQNIQSGPKAIFAHSVLGGFASVAQGGELGHGLAAGAAGKAITLGLSGMAGPGGLYEAGANGFALADFHHIAARTTVAAIIGGSVSELSGGTFANGAVTAAMQHLFNAEKLGEKIFNNKEWRFARLEERAMEWEPVCDDCSISPTGKVKFKDLELDVLSVDIVLVKRFHTQVTIEAEYLIEMYEFNGQPTGRVPYRSGNYREIPIGNIIDTEYGVRGEWAGEPGKPFLTWGRDEFE